LEPQLAALGVVRQPPALAKLEEVCVRHYANGPVQWPPFIPPSLRALRIEVHSDERSVTESLLSALAGMLGASGARLERLEIILPNELRAIGDGLVHVAQALRCCSSTLKDLFLTMWAGDRIIYLYDEEEDHASQVERLRVQWADVLAGVSACRELQVLVLPHPGVEFLFPSGTAFARLTHLEIGEAEREHPPDAGGMGLWELMASGGLPALAKLSVRPDGRWGNVEAVAGTLTHL
jgi:hypothetical protein